jgi:hypothetical protein
VRFEEAVAEIERLKAFAIDVQQARERDVLDMMERIARLTLERDAARAAALEEVLALLVRRQGTVKMTGEVIGANMRTTLLCLQQLEADIRAL